MTADRRRFGGNSRSPFSVEECPYTRSAIRLRRQLALEYQLKHLCQLLLDDYRDEEEWIAVSQVAHSLVTNSERISFLKQQLLSGEYTSTPRLESIVEHPTEVSDESLSFGADLNTDTPLRLAGDAGSAADGRKPLRLVGCEAGDDGPNTKARSQDPEGECESEGSGGEPAEEAEKGAFNSGIESARVHAAALFSSGASNSSSDTEDTPSPKPEDCRDPEVGSALLLSSTPLCPSPGEEELSDKELENTYPSWSSSEHQSLTLPTDSPVSVPTTSFLISRGGERDTVEGRRPWEEAATPILAGYLENPGHSEEEEEDRSHSSAELEGSSTDNQSPETKQTSGAILEKLIVTTTAASLAPSPITSPVPVPAARCGTAESSRPSSLVVAEYLVANLPRATSSPADSPATDSGVAGSLVDDSLIAQSVAADISLIESPMATFPQIENSGADISVANSLVSESLIFETPTASSVQPDIPSSPVNLLAVKSPTSEEGSVDSSITDNLVAESQGAGNPKADTLPVHRQKADSPPVQEPKADSPPVQEPKADSPPVQIPKVDSPPVQEPKADSPPVQEPRADTSPVQEPKADSPPVQGPRANTSPVQEPKADTPFQEPKADTPVQEPKADTPVQEPKADTPVQGPKADTPVQEPKADTPVQGPKADTPVQEPKTDTPVQGPKADTPVQGPKADTPVSPSPREASSREKESSTSITRPGSSMASSVETVRVVSEEVCAASDAVDVVSDALLASAVDGVALEAASECTEEGEEVEEEEEEEVVEEEVVEEEEGEGEITTNADIGHTANGILTIEEEEKEEGEEKEEEKEEVEEGESWEGCASEDPTGVRNGETERNGLPGELQTLNLCSVVIYTYWPPCMCSGKAQIVLATLRGFNWPPCMCSGKAQIVLATLRGFNWPPCMCSGKAQIVLEH